MPVRLRAATTWKPSRAIISACGTFQKSIPKAHQRDPTVNGWIRTGTWSLINERAWLRPNGKLDNGAARSLERKIKSSSKEDRIERARKVGETVSVHLAKEDVKKE